METLDFFNTVAEAIEDLKNGKMIIVVDDKDRENEGDIIMLAEKTGAEHINFMAIHGRGLICVAMTSKRLKELDIGPMTNQNSSLMGTAFTVSVDYKVGTSTGISAADRAATVRALVDENADPDDFAKPGHIFPIAAAKGGVLRRAGHTESVVDLARLSGARPAGVLCEVMDKDGTMARMPALKKLAEEFDLKIVTVKDIIEYRRRAELLVSRVAIAKLPTRWGDFDLYVYDNQVDDAHHIALVKGTISPEEPVMVRVHSECLTGDVFGSMRCDCGDQLHKALEMIDKQGKGVLLYMRQEGRGIGLPAKIQAYHLQDNGRDTVEANLALGYKPDLRDYGIGAQILYDLGVRKIDLMTNNPKKVVGLEGYGLSVDNRIPIETTPNSCNLHYLKTKRDKLGHLILLNQEPVETEK